MKKLFLLTFALLGLGLLTSCGGNAKYLEEPIKDARFYTGYYVQISIYDKGKRQALEDAFDLMEKQTRKIEINEQGLSEIDNVNNASGKKAVEVSKDVYGLLDETLQFAKKTDGAFNPAIGVSSLLWHIGFPDANVPNEEFLTAAQKLLNYEDIELNEANQSVFLKKEGMKLDLGGVGKAWVAKSIVEKLKENGVTSAVLDFGGHTFIIGENPINKDGKWTVNFQDPQIKTAKEQEKAKNIGKITTDKKAIIETNIYGRYLEVDGKVYSHLLDSKTGRPADTNLLSVFIVGNDFIQVDLLSNALYNMGVEKGLEYANKSSDFGVVFVTKDKKIYTSNEVKNDFVFDTNSGYTLVE